MCEPEIGLKIAEGTSDFNWSRRVCNMRIVRSGTVCAFPEPTLTFARAGCGRKDGKLDPQEHNLVIHRQDSYIIRWLYVVRDCIWPHGQLRVERAAAGGPGERSRNVPGRDRDARSTAYPSLRKHAR